MSNSLNQFPKARTAQLIIKELPDETLVYDLADDKAHCLNQTAAMVWKNCDGEKSISEINETLASGLGAAVDERVVWLALEQLEKFKLLAAVPTESPLFSGSSRRQLLRTLAVGAFALPVIATIVAPTPAQAASCTALANRDPGCACQNNADCMSGNCTNTPPKLCN